MQRSNSFIIIEIEMNGTLVESYSTIIKNIKLNQTVFEAIRNYLYYIFSFLYLFVKEYSVSKCYISNQDKIINIYNINIILFDNGIWIKKLGILIPYENLIYINKHDKNTFTMSCLIKFENDKLVLGDSVSTFEFYLPEPNNFQKLVIDNMNYHLKYNKIDTGILKYNTVQEFKTKKDK